MFNFLMNSIKTGLLWFLLNDYLKRNYPDKYDAFFITSSYKLICLYSKGQLLYNKAVVKLNLIIESNPQLKKIVNDIYKKNVIKNEIYHIKNDSIHIKYYTDNKEQYFEPDENSIYLFCDNEKAIETRCINRVILHSQPFNTNYEVSNIQFMLVEVKVNDVSYKINLKTEKFNYYIVDNILDLKFFKYYLYNYQICQLTSEDKLNMVMIHVKIIDHDINVREFEVSDDKFIIIKKNDYIY